jgi:photosystem II stability/assembly factor-like uncharacterized protein
MSRATVPKVQGRRGGIKVFKFLGKYKGPVVFFLAVVLIGVFSATAFLIVDVEYVCAHSPHDVINALEISPTYDQDGTLFIIVNDDLLKSTDGGFGWKKLVKGLDGVSYLSSIAISPGFGADQTVFVSADGDGIYKSQDGGASWAKVNRGLNDLRIGLLAISPRYAGDGIALAAGTKGGLYKTNNGGGNWYEVIDAGVNVTAIAFSPDLDKNLIVIGDDESQVWFSEDQGETWEKGYQIPEGGAVTTIAISDQVSKDRVFFIGTERRGIFETVDGGASFVEMKGGPSRYSVDFEKRLSFVQIRPPDKHVMSLALSPDFGQDGTVFVSTWWKAVFRSDNGGRTWHKYGYDAGVTCDVQANTEAYRSPHFRQLKVSNAFAEDGTVFLAGFDGLFKSTDGGQTWMQLETLPVRLITGLGVSPADEYDFSVMITTYGGGAYTTCNRKNTWAISNNGLETTRLVDVTFSPAYSSDHTVFSGSRGALLKSTDGGDNWDRIELSKVENHGQPYPTWIVLSPNFAVDQTLYFGTRVHGILESSDGGLHSAIIWDGMGEVINSLVMSPDFIADGTLFASVRGEGIYRTEDWGETWESANNGLALIETWKSTGLHLSDKDVLLAISPNYREDKTLFAGSATAKGLFKTTDGGASWQKLAGVAYDGEEYILGMAISPDYRNDETLIISVKGRGLFRTDDGGLTFVEIGDELINNNHAIELIEFSPLYSTDHTIHAASDEEIFRSTDGGNSWELMSRPVRYEDMREVVRYEGEWQKKSGSNYSAASVTQSDVANSIASLGFIGTGVNWIGTEGNDQGIAKAYIDGSYVRDVDQFGDTSRSMVVSFSVADLDYGWHTITVEVTGVKNSASTGHRITVDAFDVEP